MSATGRGAVRAVQNFYPTPAWCVRRLLEGLALPGGRWMECAAGEGAIIRAVKRPDVTWTAVEPREEAAPKLEATMDQVERTSGRTGHRILIDNFLTTTEWFPRFDVVLTNPPFPLAIPFVERALKMANVVVMLLSTGILGSEERADWWPEHVADQLLIPDRISFRGGGADCIYCSWFVWYADQLQRPWGRYRVLPHTPRAEQLEDLGQLTLLPVDPQVALL